MSVVHKLTGNFGYLEKTMLDLLLLVDMSAYDTSAVYLFLVDRRTVDI
jgi:hypothetical protein